MYIGQGANRAKQDFWSNDHASRLLIINRQGGIEAERGAGRLMMNVCMYLLMNVMVQNKPCVRVCVCTCDSTVWQYSMTPWSSLNLLCSGLGVWWYELVKISLELGRLGSSSATSGFLSCQFGDKSIHDDESTYWFFCVYVCLCLLCLSLVMYVCMSVCM
jgi:hypothetical protein